MKRRLITVPVALLVFTTLTFGHWTTTVPEPDSGSSLSASTVAVLTIVAHDASVVGDETCTARDAPAGRSP